MRHSQQRGLCFRSASDLLFFMNDSPPPLPSSGKPLGLDPGMRLLLPVGRSVWAIIAGYLGLFSVTLVLAPLAVICGAVAIVDIQKSKSGTKRKYGLGRAIFGLIMGVLGTVVLAIVLYDHYLG